MSILIFLIILSALVIVHELGHLLAAKYFGIRVDEFGLGYPPRAKKMFSWRGTDFTLNWLPFGGFVKIFGENMAESNNLEVELPSNSFQAKSRGIQAWVLFAGVFFNFLFAWMLLAIVHHSLSQGLFTAFNFTFETVRALFHVTLSNVIGPVGIVGIVGEVSKLGFSYVLTFTALISINLCLINLLPFPALDGGRLLFVGIETLTRRPIPPRIFNALNSAGFALLILLMILITTRDIRNLFKSLT
ncbi:MAG: site-2 protease family protein [Candidatus Zambryskibacteria bacterium]|nr:site-2 protease family protein [Candidatus Zambryskibacteria bacterium]